MSDRDILRGAAAGIIYFAAVFSVGFVLGAVRTLTIAPSIGDFAAVAVELPVMLAAAWVICHWITKRFDVPRNMDVRVVMGLTAFCCLMAGEMLISIVLLERNFVEHLALYREPAAQLGLAGQLMFGIFPLLADDR